MMHYAKTNVIMMSQYLYNLHVKYMSLLIKYCLIKIIRRTIHVCDEFQRICPSANKQLRIEHLSVRKRLKYTYPAS